MSGHSKWHNIQKTKGAADAKRAQVEDIVKRKTGVEGQNIVITTISSDGSKQESTEGTEQKAEIM